VVRLCRAPFTSPGWPGRPGGRKLHMGGNETFGLMGLFLG
jgi:hypothetical protein